jgi:hypothetical protein
MKESGFLKDAKKIKVYWKKAEVEDQLGNLNTSFLILCVDQTTERANFFVFDQGTENLSINEFSIFGYLGVEKSSASCIDCQGGLWTQNYIEEASNKLLKIKSFSLKIKNYDKKK